MTDDLRSTLEAIAFGADSRISPSDRIRAIEQLGQLPVPQASVERLNPEQVEAELEAFGMPAAIAVARGPDAVQPPPVDLSEYEEVIGLQQQVIEALEARVGERDRALQRVMCQRLLPRAAEAVV